MKSFFENWLSSWTGNRPQELIKFYHPEVFYLDPGYKDGITGISNLENSLVKLLAKFPDWKWTLISFDQVSETRYYVKWEFSMEGLGKTRGLDLVEVKNGLIIRNEVYFDTSIFQQTKKA